MILQLLKNVVEIEMIVTVPDILQDVIHLNVQFSFIFERLNTQSTNAT